MACLILGYTAGRTTPADAGNWCERHKDWLAKFIDVSAGIPSGSTLWRMTDMLDEDDLTDVFTQWMAELAKGKNRIQIIDGKGIRAATLKNRGERTPYMLTGLDAETRLAIAQVPVGPKENEKVAIHTYLETIDVSTNILILDAVATDTNIINHIIQCDGNYVLQIKRNNPEKYSELMTLFHNGLISEAKKKQEYEKNGKMYDSYLAEPLKTYTEYYSGDNPTAEHGRIEYRWCWATQNVSAIPIIADDWPSAKTIAAMKHIRIPVERDAEGNDITVSCEEFEKHGSKRNPNVKTGDSISDDIQYVFLISNMDLTATDIAMCKRLYWTVESSQHYVADNTNMLEDRCTATKNKFKFAIIRKMAYNLRRIAQNKELCGESMKNIAYTFCDCPDIMAKYYFDPIESFA